MKELIWEDDVYLPGSTWEQALIQGEEKGKVNTEFNTIAALLGLLIEVPDMKDTILANINRTTVKKIKILRKSLQSETAEKAHRLILTEFFKNAKLSEEQELVLRERVELFYKE